MKQDLCYQATLLHGKLSLDWQEVWMNYKYQVGRYCFGSLSV